ncbi:hypothetical protein Daus18300_012592 [Diaporthe australafricana]|uniref:rRNA adenine N(6)-methyltransferase n=1 Tax=Diaporthe australafricana TaxID=127596 RepID=A0ABR3W2E2_9PEZI
MEELFMPLSGLAPAWSRVSKHTGNLLYEDLTKVATQLKKTGLFRFADDIISYIKPSLERHKGCDLVSIYPGVGLFTKALHDAVQPRSHLLLEPDESLYKPFLQSLLKEKNVRLVPKSGIIWHELEPILSPEYLPNQVEIDRLDLDKDPPKNDTLLVSMNLSMYPKKKYNLFDNMSRMILYQLLSSIRTSTQFQKYGRVRMLVWIPDEEKDTILPRLAQSRKKSAVEGELVSEYIAEVCGKDGTLDDEGEAVKDRNNKVRPQQLNFESMRQALVRMRDNGIITPKGRETRLLRQFKQMRISVDTPIPLTAEPFTFDKSFQPELDELQRQHDIEPTEKHTKAGDRYRVLLNYRRWIDRISVKLLDFTQKIDALTELHRQAAEAKAEGNAERAQELVKEATRLNEEYDRAVHGMPAYLTSQLSLLRDQLHVLRQPEGMGPVLSWDRRPWEPLRVQPGEFFPNVPCALLDIQPKAPHRLLRHIGPGTSNAGDIFDMMLGMIMQNTVVPLVHTMDHIWPGARDGLEDKCESLVDPSRGGSPLTGEAAFASRAANQTQLLELLEEFMKWPFMPSYAELIGRLEDDKLIDDGSLRGLEDDSPGGVGMGNTTMDAF